MRFLLLLLFLTGCTTNKITGAKRFLGIIPTPFTGPPPPPLSTEQMAFVAMAPFRWASLLLIIGGAVFWKLTNGSTGLGILLFSLGWVILLAAITIPQIAGYLGIIAICGLVILAGYLIYKFVRKIT